MKRGGRDVELGLLVPQGERDADETLAALAEERRKAGEPDAALRLAHEALERDPEDVAARATAALASLDLGRDADARRLLEVLVAPEIEEIALEALADDELEDAFAEAEPEATAMRDANDLAYDAMRAAALDAPEGVSVATSESPFHTRTMAALLEQQGAAAEADSIRAALAHRDRADHRDSAPVGRRRGDRIRVLEQWLERTRRGNA
jgi:Tetratricopeptide repeat